MAIAAVTAVGAAASSGQGGRPALAAATSGVSVSGAPQVPQHAVSPSPGGNGKAHLTAKTGGAGAAHRSGAGNRSGDSSARQPAHPQHQAGKRSPCHSSEIHWWICHAELILRQHGTPTSAIDTEAAFIVVMHESGGDPRAYNGWDSNAAAGTPSEGIAQVIGPTFSSYRLHGYGDIWNPVDNMVAAFRYAVNRYGSMNNIPGVVAVRGGGSYVGY
jgi:hypothetical protein